MPTEFLMEGAEAYTSLAEVAAGPETDAPEATPIVSMTITLINVTVYLGC
ncbi:MULTISPECIES: LxmA leader domain family RiPP [unclassified Streptosporangium]